MKQSEQTIQNRVGIGNSHDDFWWSATDGAAVIVDSASSKKQAIATIAEYIRLGAVQRLRLERCHAIKACGWRIALQKPEESPDDFLNRSCGQKKTTARRLPVAHRRPHQRINSADARP